MYARKCRDLSSERVDSLELEKASLISATKSSLLFLIIESGICKTSVVGYDSQTNNSLINYILYKSRERETETHREVGRQL